MGGSGKYCKEYGTHEYDVETRKAFKEDIKYIQQHLIVITTLPNSSTQTPPKPHTNDPIDDPWCTGNYINALTITVNIRDPSENQIKVKLLN